MAAYGFAAVGLGAAFGAWLRWWLGLRLNSLLVAMPLGTLAANLIGGFLVGVAIATFDRHPGVPPEARLFVITGFLGGLTTFSTFSAEISTLVLRREWLWGALGIGAHVVGSIVMTLGGLVAMRALFQWGSP